MLTEGRTNARVTGILLAHTWAFGSGELKTANFETFFEKIPCSKYLKEHYVFCHLSQCKCTRSRTCESFIR